MAAQDPAAPKAAPEGGERQAQGQVLPGMDGRLLTKAIARRARLDLHGAAGRAAAGRRRRRPHYVGPEHAETYIRALAVLGTVGVFALFAMASGIMRLASKVHGNPLLKAVVDNAFDGILVTDQSGAGVLRQSRLSRPDRGRRR